MTTLLPRAFAGFSKSHYLLTVAAALTLAGCSDAMDRFGSNPSDVDPVYTASVPKQQKGFDESASGDAITSKPLANASPSKNGTYNYSSNYKAPAYDYNAPKQQTASSMGIGSTSGSGKSVTIEPGMTLYSVAKANNISVAELAAANGLKPPYDVRTGQTLRLPGAGGQNTPAMNTASAEPQTMTTTASRKPGEMHKVASGETLFSLGRTYGVSPYAIADANGLSHDASLRVGQEVKIPAGGPVANLEKPKVVKATVKDSERVGEETITPNQKTAAAGTAQPLPDPTVTTPPDAGPVAEGGQAPTPETAAGKDPSVDAGTASADASATGLRWPVRGKVISSFGQKPNGLKNEGINIAVPEGTSIRAASDGVVAYAGNELKGYGNLVLIRHSDGYVTAYAHCKELFVKRGDTVKRGDVIAKAGQTGSVSSPQLHFEVRKGATAMDPMQFLSSATATN